MGIGPIPILFTNLWMWCDVRNLSRFVSAFYLQWYLVRVGFVASADVWTIVILELIAALLYEVRSGTFQKDVGSLSCFWRDSMIVSIDVVIGWQVRLLFFMCLMALRSVWSPFRRWIAWVSLILAVWKRIEKQSRPCLVRARRANLGLVSSCPPLSFRAAICWAL